MNTCLMGFAILKSNSNKEAGLYTICNSLPCSYKISMDISRNFFLEQTLKCNF